MPVTLADLRDDAFGANELRDGQLAVIVSANSYYGRVVQMLKAKHNIKSDTLISVGMPNGSTWSDPVPASIRVRPLQAGEKIEVTAN